MITILFPGKVKSDFLKSGIKKFSKLLTHYNTNIIFGTSGGFEKEKRFILKNSNNKFFKIALDHRGEHINSEQFAGLFAKHVNIEFIIGGSHGFPNGIIEKCKKKLSFSPMVFSHEIILLVLLEQIYRAQCINSNHPYHQ